MQYVSTAFELVARNHGIRDHDRDGSHDARGRVVSGFEQVGYRELGKAARPSGDQRDDYQSHPAACGLPKRGESISVRVLPAGEKAAGANPRLQKREYQNRPGQLSASHQKVRLVLHGPRLDDGNYAEAAYH